MTLPLNITMRAQDVTRWHTVNTNRKQTLADHMWGVTMIALALMESMEDLEISLSSTPTPATFIALLTHDLDEIFKGDTPAPAKDAVAGAGHRPVPFSSPLEALIKVADAIEAWWWITNNGAGMYTNKTVLRDTENRMTRRIAQAADQFCGSKFHAAAEAVITKLTN